MDNTINRLFEFFDTKFFERKVEVDSDGKYGLNYDGLCFDTYLGYSIYDIDYLSMADIVEIELDESQNLCFRNLRDSNNHLTDFLFVSSEDIKSLGVRAGTKDLQEVIADHSVKILQENADKLVRRDEYQKIYDIQL